MEQKTKIEAPDGKQDVIITREFNLPVDLLYKAYSEAQFVEQWMGTKVLKLENKTHGSYEFETSYNGNVVFKAHGTIHEVIENQSIIRTFEMENMAIGVQLELLTFEAISDETSMLSIRIIYQSEKHRAEQMKLPFAYGLNMAHDTLETLKFNNA
ncbi:MAG: ATPase [Pedobacter sp.]|nr:MAG: ATPase [Pedobacter sp.]